jgi:hypothetical protein
MGWTRERCRRRLERRAVEEAVLHVDDNRLGASIKRRLDHGDVAEREPARAESRAIGEAFLQRRILQIEHAYLSVSSCPDSIRAPIP